MNGFETDDFHAIEQLGADARLLPRNRDVYIVYIGSGFSSGTAAVRGACSRCVQRAYRVHPGEHACDIADAMQSCAMAAFASASAEMRTEQNIAHAQQCWVDTGLIFENVKGGASQVAGLERGYQRCFVHDATAGGID